MRVNNNRTINPDTQELVQQIYPARSKRVKKVTLVKSGQGGASGNNGDVFVPAGDTAYDRTVRLHEALHLDFTTKKFTPKDALDQGLEDARLHKYCSRTKKVRSARRDEICVAVKDLRKAIKKSAHETPTAITSLVILRAAAILNGETKHSKLLSTAANLIGSNYLSEVNKAIKIIEPGTESRQWNKARKLLNRFFAKDFTPQQKPEQKQQKGNRQQSQIGEQLPDLPQPDYQTESEPEDGSTKSETTPEVESEPEDGSTKSETTPEVESDPSQDKTEKTEAPEPDSKDESDEETDESEEDEDTEELSGEEETEGEDSSNIIDVEEVKKPKRVKLHPDIYRGAAISKYDPDPDRAAILDKAYHKDLYIHRLDNQSDSVPTISGNRGRVASLSGCRINSGRLAMAMRTNVRVFNRRRGEGGGAILIDNSGSMSIPQQVLINFAANLPLATIAFYSAANDLNSTKSGHLSVYAANGRRAGKLGIETYGGYGNLVDYQAINWLMEQPGPRWYVGDTIFTGAWRNHCRWFFNSLVDRKLVTRVRNLAQMTKALESRR